MLPPDNDVRLLFSPVTFIAAEGLSFLIDFDLALEPKTLKGGYQSRPVPDLNLHF
jgi:hypothetical protein